MKKQKSKLARLDRIYVNNSFPILSSLLTKEYDVSFTDENAIDSAAQCKLIQDLPKSNRLEENVKTERLLENPALSELLRFRKKGEHTKNCVHSVPEIYPDDDYLICDKYTERFNEVTEDQNEIDIDSKDEKPAMTNPDIHFHHGMEPGDLYLYFLV